ncbi:MAG: 30S ribosomal protein S20 [Omnitrophica bacterium RIFCSPHIGHO2_02_FULL_63_14]|nr:MAG: 30S ribosomal protein S20 [Omnitrophica bacterium RIFCSPHIGHO2_02_FULL_63_14]
MAHRRSSIKKIRVDRKRHEQNQRVISNLKTVTKRLKALIDQKKHPEAAACSREVFSKLDKAVKKGVIHANVASRRKSRLALGLNRLKTAQA